MSVLKSLPDEVRKLWHFLPRKGVLALLFAAWFGLFHFLGSSTFGYLKSGSLFAWMQNVFAYSPDDELCLYVPLLVLVLLYVKRDELLAVELRPSWAAVWLVAGGLLLHLAGYVVQQARVSILGLVIGVYGLTGVVWGLQWLRCTFFPMCLLVFLIPIAALSESITLPLRLVSTKLAVGTASGVLGINVSQNGAQILGAQGTPLYEVAPACSGIRSLTTLTLLMVVYGFLTFRAYWKRALLVLLAMPVAVAGNGLRLVTVIVVGEWMGVDAATAVEQKLGFVTFGLGLASMMLVGHWLREPPVPPAAEQPSAA